MRIGTDRVRRLTVAHHHYHHPKKVSRLQHHPIIPLVDDIEVRCQRYLSRRRRRRSWDPNDMIRRRKKYLRYKADLLTILEDYRLAMLARLEVWWYWFCRVVLFLNPCTVWKSRDLWDRLRLWVYYLRSRFSLDKEETRNLLEWVKSKAGQVPVPDNFSSGWKDGVLLCALVEGIVPGSCPRYDLLNPENGLSNAKLALQLIEKNTGIKPVLTAEELVECRPKTERKLLCFLAQLKLASAKLRLRAALGRPIIKLNEQETTFAPEQECFAKGMGLILAVKGRKASFNIFLKSSANLNIVIEIRGPSNSLCSERITNRSPKKKCSPMKSLLDAHEEKSEPGKSKVKRIPFEYEILPGKISVRYSPVVSGKHQLSIIWQGQHIMGSPYTVCVDGRTDEEDPRAQILQKLFTNPKTSSHKALSPFAKKFLAPPVINPFTQEPHVCSCGKSETRSFNPVPIPGLSKFGRVRKRRIVRRIIDFEGEQIVVEGDDPKKLAEALQDTYIRAKQGKNDRNGKSPKVQMERILQKKNTNEPHKTKTWKKIIESTPKPEEVQDSESLLLSVSSIRDVGSPSDCLTNDTDFELQEVVRTEEEENEQEQLSIEDDELVRKENIEERLAEENSSNQLLDTESDLLKETSEKDSQEELQNNDYKYALTEISEHKMLENVSSDCEDKNPPWSSPVYECDYEFRIHRSTLTVHLKSPLKTQTSHISSENNDLIPEDSLYENDKDHSVPNTDANHSFEDLPSQASDKPMEPLLDNKEEPYNEFVNLPLETSMDENKKKYLQRFPAIDQMEDTPVAENPQEDSHFLHSKDLLHSEDNLFRAEKHIPTFQESKDMELLIPDDQSSLPTTDSLVDYFKEFDKVFNDSQMDSSGQLPSEYHSFDKETECVYNAEVSDQYLPVKARVLSWEHSLPQSHPSVSPQKASPHSLSIVQSRKLFWESCMSSAQKQEEDPISPGHVPHTSKIESKRNFWKSIEQHRESSTLDKDDEEYYEQTDRQQTEITQADISVQDRCRKYRSFSVPFESGKSSEDPITMERNPIKNFLADQCTFNLPYNSESILSLVTEDSGLGRSLCNKTSHHRNDTCRSEECLQVEPTGKSSSFNFWFGTQAYQDRVLCQNDFSQSTQNLSVLTQCSERCNEDLDDCDSFDFNAETTFIDDDIQSSLLLNDYSLYQDLKNCLELNSSSKSSNALEDDMAFLDRVTFPEKCEASGSGLYYGQVSSSNQFQVKTKGAGHGGLSVLIQGPKAYSVLETAVKYEGNDIYSVHYSVTDPGFYLINVKWANLTIPESPFICEVSS